MPPDRRHGFPLSVPVPPSLSLSSTPLLVEASPEGVAQMEKDALGCEGACVGDGLGFAHDGFALGSEFGAQAQAYAEDGALSLAH